MKENCWEFMNCGKGPDARESCTASFITLYTGLNDGTNGGRICWAVPNTSCKNEEKFFIGEKILLICAGCPFLSHILQENGRITFFPEKFLPQPYLY